MSLWQLFAPKVVDRCAVGLAYEHGDHVGFLDRLELLADGSCLLRFEDRVTISIPPIKENR